MSDSPAAYAIFPRILLAGQYNDGVSRNVAGVLVEETSAGLYRCEVALHNWGNTGAGAEYLYLGRDVIDFGMEIELQLGFGEPPPTIFTGRITAFEANYGGDSAPLLTVLAEDRLQDLRMTRRTRNFEDLSDADIIEQIAREHSLTADLALDGETHTSVAQVNQSDLAFIRERARAVNGELWVQSTTLYGKRRQERGNGSAINLRFGANLSAFTVRADLAHQCSELLVSGWDVAGKTGIRETASEGAISSEIQGGTGGGSILEQQFGARKAQIVHAVPLTSAEARGIAMACYAERARRFVTGTGMIESGDPRVKVGAVVNLSDLGRMFDGQYVVVRARHTFDAGRGYQTEFDVERPAIG
jgi:phage protein D